MEHLVSIGKSTLQGNSKVVPHVPHRVDNTATSPTSEAAVVSTKWSFDFSCLVVEERSWPVVAV